MADEVKVERIVIKIGDKEHEFSMEEAKELQKLLNDLLGEKEVIYIPYSQPVIYPQPVYVEPYRYIPYYPERTAPNPYINPWIITCGTGDDPTRYAFPTVVCTYNGTSINY